MGVPKLKEFSVAELSRNGFRGFVTFDNLNQQYSPNDGGVPTSPGVYIVLRTTAVEPTFLAKGFAGPHKAKRRNADVNELLGTWVPGACVVYVGRASLRQKADGLWGRLSEYRTAGTGASHGHYGGQHIWQLSDARSLLVAWKVTGSDKLAKDQEKSIILAFHDKYGQIPFANRSTGG